MTDPNAGDTRRRPVFNAGVRLHPVDLAGWHSLKLVPMGETGETASVWERGAAWVRVSLAELPSDREALGQLQTTLEHVMRPDLPPAVEHGLDVGDISRAVVDDAGVGGAVWFVRGNSCVAVNRANDAPADTFAVAKAIDLFLVVPPFRRSQLIEHLGAGPAIVVESLARLAGRRLHVTAPAGRFVTEADAVLYYPPVDDSRMDATLPIPVAVTIGDY
ncbi:hypothetical protein BJ973_003099 [Actinoplanes tereljensis]|uniref:Uncharacterized protein n=1 Tax=Paractinoplanes tereljensis TaxID=571912 RepID=A0A919NVA3_9ACTN|nr:hypothetical protein [Actinoplanes tereljensis]GIF25825.1 hypothetical protein Ate02nite_85550 [Actinoplanes tereljensis]